MRATLLAFAMLVGAAGMTAATIETYTATIVPMNGDGVTGTATFTFTGNTFFMASDRFGP